MNSTQACKADSVSSMRNHTQVFSSTLFTNSKARPSEIRIGERKLLTKPALASVATINHFISGYSPKRFDQTGRLIHRVEDRIIWGLLCRFGREGRSRRIVSKQRLVCRPFRPFLFHAPRKLGPSTLAEIVPALQA